MGNVNIVYCGSHRVWVFFCDIFLSVLFCFAIILLRNRELINLPHS